MPERDHDWDIEADVVVLGTGGAGLTAALAAHDYGAGDVVVIEKSGMVGGTTAMSGGMLWIPLNPHQETHGVEDSWDKVVTYLDALAPGRLDPETLSAFLESGPEMIRFFDEQTPVRLRLFRDFPDYQPQIEGALPGGGRSFDPDPFPFEELGSWATRVNPPKVGGPKITSRIEDRLPPLDPDAVAERQRRDCRGEGQALIGSLLKGILDRSIPIHFETRARKLCREDGRVIGVIAERASQELRVRARKGVVIATGGFEWNEELVKTFLRGPMTAPVSVPENEGDGLIMAMEVGAALGNMSNAWWVMAAKESSAHGRGTHPNYLLCSSERAKPGSILVNRSARRFVNEATNYNALGHVLHNFDSEAYDYPNLPYWLIVDSRFTSRYRLFTSRPGQPAPAFAKTAETISELAELIGLHGAVLTETVERFNESVRRGHDDEFGRGDSVFDSFWGDQSFEPPFTNLATIEHPPYYAVEVEAGALGTCGGPKTDAEARVLDLDGNPIGGLYAASNAMAGVTAGAYGGGGGTLGPGMTFGFIAGRHAAQKG
jgi:3-oxosteroid 1-dehydrogenase